MENNIECPKCGYDIDICYNICTVCGYIIPVTTELETINKPIVEDVVLANYPIGESVVIKNQEHPFYNEIALVCDTKHLFVRLELNGIKIWMPSKWVKNYDQQH